MGVKAIGKRFFAHLMQTDITKPSSNTNPELVKNKMLETQKIFDDLVGTSQLAILAHHASIDTITREFQQRKDRDQIDIAMIDYVGMIQGSKAVTNQTNSYQAVGDVVKSMQSLSTELEIPFFLASQVNRSTFGEIPSMKNVAESMQINFAADAVQFLWRPEKSAKGIVGASAGHWNKIITVVTDKCRSGETAGLMYYHFDGGTSRYIPVTDSLRKILESPEEQRKIFGA